MHTHTHTYTHVNLPIYLFIYFSSIFVFAHTGRKYSDWFSRLHGPTTSRSVDINRRRRRHGHHHVDRHCAQGKEMEVDSSLKDEKYFSLNDNKFISSFVFLFSTLHFFLMHQSINQLIYLSKFSGCLALPVKLVSMRPTCSSQGPTTTMTRTMARRPSPASTECCWSPPPPAPPRPL